MSLKSTRKRLKDYVELLKYGADEVVHNSVLSKIGRNPASLVDMLKLAKKIKAEKGNEIFNPQNLQSVKDREIEKRVEENNRLKRLSENYIEKEELNRLEKKSYRISFDGSAKNVKDKIKFSDDKENINIQEKNYVKNRKKEIKEEKGKRKLHIGFIITMVVVELITLAIIFAVGFFIRFNELKQVVEFNKSAVHNTNISETHLKAMEGYRTIAVFGLDSRTGSVAKGNNADVNIIVNINLGTGEVKLVSVYRDLYLNINDNNSYGKLNSAYMYGGPERSVKALNKNMDLNIFNYASFNWKSVAEIIDLLGGIDIEITKREFQYMNSFIHETCIATGTDPKNPALHYIESSGYQHLTGVQAVAYSRLRLMDSDFQRVERQKKVIELCLQKAKKLSIDNLIGIASEAAQMIAFDIDWGELISLINNIDNINIVETASFPPVNDLLTMQMGSSGDSVVPKNLEKSVIELHDFLYGEKDYEVSKAVRSYSNRIIELKNKYAEENRIKESIKQSEAEEESKRAESRKKRATRSNTRITTKKSSKSNANKTSNITNNKNEKGEVIPNIFEEEYDEYYYEEEPTNDEIGFSNGPYAPGTGGPINNNAPYSSADSSGPSSSAPTSSKNTNTSAPISGSPVSSEDNSMNIGNGPMSSANENNTNTSAPTGNIPSNAPGNPSNNSPIFPGSTATFPGEAVTFPGETQGSSGGVGAVFPGGSSSPQGTQNGAPIAISGPPIG